MIGERLPLIALGSNASDRLAGSLATVRAAIGALEAAGLPVARASRMYSTPCFPKGNGPDFVNAVVAVDSALAPGDILQRLHRIEGDFYRERGVRWAPRTLDLDLLAHDDVIVPNHATQRHWMELPLERQLREAPDELIVPHPRLHERAFVLVPLADVAPDWVHPVLGRTVRRMLADLPPDEVAAIRPLGDDGTVTER